MLSKFLVLTSIFVTSTIEICSSTEHKIEEIFGDEGDSINLPCHISDKSSIAVKWIHQGRDDRQIHRTSILANKSLSLTEITRDDSGIYSCSQEDKDIILNTIKVSVRTPPPALVNVTVVPSSILALLQWEVADSGGYPVTYFTAQYRLKHTPPHQAPDPWHPAIPGGYISPTASQIDIYQLKPNSSYVFQIWANNQLGRGDIVELEACTLNDPQEIELARHLLEGVETFDTRVWVAAVAVVMGTLVVLASATIYALYKEWHIPVVSGDDQETMELIPNIIINPAFNEELHTPDENSNDTFTVHFNNNSIVNPIRM